MSLILALATAAAVQPTIVDRRDPIDDARVVMVYLEAPKSYLGVGCANAADRSSIMVIAKFERFVGREAQSLFGGGGTPVQYRFDQRSHRNEGWSSQRYVIKQRGAYAMRFIQAMKGSRQVYLRARREDGDIVQIAFTYGDPTRLIDDVLGRCGLNPDGSRRALPR